MTPKISVIVPVYKVEKYLPKCIDSILAQTFTDFELLLIDDGSPDNSGAICDEYAKKDSRIRVFHKENGGVSSARNLGLDEAKGEWVWFVDGDDWVAEGAIGTIIDTIENNNVDVLQISIQGVTNEISPIYLDFNKELIEPTNVSEFVNKLSFNGSVCASIYSRNIIKENYLRFIVGLKLAEDQLFILSYLRFCNTIMKSDLLAYYYRMNQESASRSASNTDLIESFSAIIDFEFRDKFSDYCDILMIRKAISIILNNNSLYSFHKRFISSGIREDSLYSYFKRYNVPCYIRYTLSIYQNTKSYMLLVAISNMLHLSLSIYRYTKYRFIKK
ncbi:MAG: glycosyltransferase family 2 protein [Bacteroidales bacterium]